VDVLTAQSTTTTRIDQHLPLATLSGTLYRIYINLPYFPASISSPIEAAPNMRGSILDSMYGENVLAFDRTAAHDD
jgi:hypothetical protein